MVKPYTPHSPSRKQDAFLRLDVEEAGYGGSAGGGKTDALIMAALQYVDVPTYSAGLFRLRDEDLHVQDAVGDRCRVWFTGTAAKWDAKARAWRFPAYDSNPGASIHLGFGRSRSELEVRYQGPAFQSIGIEELGQWQEDAYTYLFSRLRRTAGVAAKPRMRSTFNPGGDGAEWIRARFIEHAHQVGTGFSVRQYNAMRKRSEELPAPPYFVSPPSKEAEDMARSFGVKAQGVYFVPAFLEDNPGFKGELLAEYRMNLVKLDPVRRAQLDEADWWVVPGGDLFDDTSFRFVEQAPAGVKWIRYWDLASTKPSKENPDPDWTAGVKIGSERIQGGGHRFYIGDVRRFREDPGGVETNIRATAVEDGRRVDVWIEEEGGASGKSSTLNYVTRVLAGFNVEGDRKTGPKEEFWKPLSAQAKHGNLYLVIGEWNGEFMKELKALKVPKNEKLHDDQADAAGGGLAKLVGDSFADKVRRAAAR